MRFLQFALWAMPNANAMEVDESIRKVENTYKDVKSIEADFKQITTSPALPQPMQQDGHLYMMKPQLIRWDFLTPTVQSYYSDGQSITVWNEMNKQQFDSMEIAINKKSWVLEQIFVKGEMTGEITLQFSNVQLNTITESSVFSFTPPEGAEVIQTEGF